MDDIQPEAMYPNEEELKPENSYESKDLSMEAKNQKSFRCYICGKIFTEENVCKEHINICIQEGHKDYKCDHCGKLFFLESSLKKHIHAAHDTHKDYKCDFCEKTFGFWHTLQKHTNNINSVPKICEKTSDNINT